MDDDLDIPQDAGVEETIGPAPEASPYLAGQSPAPPQVPPDQPLPPAPTSLTPEQRAHALSKNQTESMYGPPSDESLLSAGWGDPYFWQRKERQRLAEQARLGARQAPAPPTEPNYHTAAGGFEPTAAQRKLALAYQFPKGHKSSMVSRSDLDQGMRDRAAQEAGMPYDPSLSQAEMTAIYDRANGAVRAQPSPTRDRMVAYTYEHLLNLEQQKRNRVMQMQLQARMKTDTAGPGHEETMAEKKEFDANFHETAKRLTTKGEHGDVLPSTDKIEADMKARHDLYERMHGRGADAENNIAFIDNAEKTLPPEKFESYRSDQIASLKKQFPDASKAPPWAKQVMIRLYGRQQKEPARAR